MGEDADQGKAPNSRSEPALTSGCQMVVQGLAHAGTSAKEARFESSLPPGFLLKSHTNVQCVM